MADLQKWDVENPEFWESEGKKIANRNLWIFPACSADLPFGSTGVLSQYRCSTWVSRLKNPNCLH